MYLEHFRLSAEPFSLTPDPGFLYLSPEHREAMAAVQYGLLAGRGFVTLVGEVGTGKTTLLYALLSQTGPEVETAYVAYTTQSFEDLLAAVLRDLRIEFRSRAKGDLLEALNAHLVRRADEGRTVALVIDEAQDLSDSTFEELRLLSNFESYTRKLLQIVLVGQPELQDRLARPGLRQLRERVGVRAVINPLDRTEMARYIAHRLQVAGGSAESLFEPRALALIVRRTGGIPRRANILCHNALLFAFGRGLPRVTVAVAREAVDEMDERRPGLVRVDRRSWAQAAIGSRGRMVAAAALVAAFVVGGYLVAPARGPRPARGPESSARAVPRRETVPAAPVAPPSTTLPPQAEEAARIEPEAAAPPPPVPAPAAEAPAVPLAPPARAEPPAGAGVQGSAPAAERPLLSLTVPRGTTLTRLLHDLYGEHLPASQQHALFAEVRRLNPHVKDVNVILAGDLLNLPPPVNPEGRGTP
ncbi:MAG: AAA family ATPase [Candidatus Binatia bacterium]